MTSKNIRGDGQTQSYISGPVIKYLLMIPIGFYLNLDSCDPLLKTMTVALDKAASIRKNYI